MFLGYELLMVQQPRLFISYDEERWMDLGAGSAAHAEAVINIGYQSCLRIAPRNAEELDVFRK
ncbi:MAG TPA: hypothetical protein VFG09_05055 [Thermodesulfovibrionales bacterium]|nr:hypothetical protein [Thermodesulfovibrionales bacterium]